ncbi:hypothetical protein [Phenylobacterium sp.]|jgi:hypothetical protein|uniref:hypothetical protein n=1 Tax=Phenylobacterium sp. TaxID=1871053 RepID=UPI000C95D567|nr:hypothetical protein [Phenylobacterium sp.]MAK82020.1 hypothetical protein [Phenylobacterium sp.]|tara:strand:+ start:27782 stop:28162 length:381 start_codon:yes stop_codon:yes gene_type:complete
MASLPKTPAAARPTIYALGLASLAIGLIKTSRPAAIADRTGLGEADMVRTLGLREMAAGAGLLLDGGDKRWLVAHGLNSAGQVAVLLKARPSGRRQWQGLALFYGVLLGLTLADVYAAQRLRRTED